MTDVVFPADARFLREQSELYTKHSEAVESWKAAHEEAMFCCDIEDTIALGLAILESIRRRMESWSRGVEEGLIPFSWEHAREIAGQYKWWLSRSTALLRALETCEKASYVVEGSDRFRKACREVSLMSLEMDSVKRSLKALEEGRGIPGKQAIDELRSRLRPQRS